MWHFGLIFNFRLKIILNAINKKSLNPFFHFICTWKLRARFTTTGSEDKNGPFFEFVFFSVFSRFWIMPVLTDTDGKLCPSVFFVPVAADLLAERVIGLRCLMTRGVEVNLSNDSCSFNIGFKFTAFRRRSETYVRSDTLTEKLLYKYKPFLLLYKWKI